MSKQKRMLQASDKPTLHLMPYGKRLIAADMYAKSRGFIHAAILLSKAKGDAHVELHLYCQGLEITLKAVLLQIDFDKYQPMLKQGFGHNISKLALEANSISKRRPLSRSLRAELLQLSNLYKATVLRYAGMFTMLVAPETIPTRRVMRMMQAMVMGIKTDFVQTASPGSQVL